MGAVVRLFCSVSHGTESAVHTREGGCWIWLTGRSLEISPFRRSVRCIQVFQMSNHQRITSMPWSYTCLAPLLKMLSSCSQKTITYHCIQDLSLILILWYYASFLTYFSFKVFPEIVEPIIKTQPSSKLWICFYWHGAFVNGCFN